MIFIDLDAKDELTPQNMRQLVARARRVLPRAITRSSRPRRDGELCHTTSASHEGRPISWMGSAFMCVRENLAVQDENLTADKVEGGVC